MEIAEGTYRVQQFAVETDRRLPSDQFVVGFSCSARQNIGPDATFVPEPNDEYQIAPSRGFYVVVGQFNLYDIVSLSVKELNSTCYVDFGASETGQVTLVHHDNGALVRKVVEDGEMKLMPPPTSMTFTRAFSVMPDAASPNAWIRVAATEPENSGDVSSTADSSSAAFTPVSSRPHSPHAATPGERPDPSSLEDASQFSA